MTVLGTHALKDRLEKLELETEEVKVPELGEDAVIRLRALTCQESGEWNEVNDLRDQMQAGKVKTYSTIGGYMVGLSMIDEKGNRVLTNRQDIVATMNQMPAIVISRSFDVCARLNKLNKKSVDELKKNSETNPENDSGSNSPGEQTPQQPS